MRVLQGTEQLAPDRFRNPVVTLGVFDGVHRGHRRVLARARELADSMPGELVVITFHVHPRAVTTGAPPPLITSLPHRLVLLRRAAVDTTIVLHFDEPLREMSAEEFVDDVLVGRIGLRALVLGHDSHFGYERRGDYPLAGRLRDPRGVPVERVEAFAMPDGSVVSSSAIRDAVAHCDLARAADLLGRPPALYGTGVRGDGRGHALGYPTANLDLGGELRPARGVYGASVEIDGVRRAAVVNIGGRPTFYPEGEARETVEVHVLDWQGDLYGRNLEAVLLGKIRDESRFASADDLRAQIARDVETMRERVAAGAWKLG